MRKTVLLWSFVVVLVALGGVFAEAAVPPQPTYGTATVDGGYNEWNLAEDGTGDFFAGVWRAGDPSKPNPVLEGKLYLRYDCSKQVMYALLLTVDGVPALVEPENTWIAIDGKGNKVTFINFEWIERNYDGNDAHAKGWEAAFSLTPGSYKFIAHTNVYDDRGSQTSSTDRKTNPDGIDLVIHCPTDAITLSSFSAKSGGASSHLDLGLGGLLVLVALCVSMARRR